MGAGDVFSGGVFAGRTFTAPEARSRWFVEALRPHLAAARALRVLDVGCGTGVELFALARVLPDSVLTGIDVSEKNVRRAETARRGDPAGKRISFVAQDYLSFSGGEFDLIIMDSTLQNIAAEDGVLYGKLARDLAPGGVLAVSWPFDCAYNRALWMLRRMLRAVRGRATDAFILGLGKVLHRGAVDACLLAERVEYMYLLPFRYDCPAARRELESRHGLKLVAGRRVPHASPGSPQHNFTVFRREKA